MTQNQRSLLLIYAQLYDADAMEQVRRIMEMPRAAAALDFEVIAADADEATRDSVAQAHASELAEAMVRYPWLRDQNDYLTKSESVTGATLAAALQDIYNVAQRDVIARAAAAARELLARRGY